MIAIPVGTIPQLITQGNRLLSNTPIYIEQLTALFSEPLIVAGYTIPLNELPLEETVGTIGDDLVGLVRTVGPQGFSLFGNLASATVTALSTLGWMLLVLVLSSVLLGADECPRIVPMLKGIGKVTETDFVGTWAGKTVDRPSEGTQKNTMVLGITSDSTGALVAVVSGNLVGNQEQRVADVHLRGNKLHFPLQAKGWTIDIWLSVETEEKKSLIGAGLPAPAPGWEAKEDSFDIWLNKAPTRAGCP